MKHAKKQTGVEEILATGGNQGCRLGGPVHDKPKRCDALFRRFTVLFGYCPAYAQSGNVIQN
jgi:hypothetical protein